MDHLSFIKQESKLPINQISRKAVDPNLPKVESIRTKTLEDGKTICRVYVQAKDTGALAGVGWVINDDIKQCMLCAHSFSFITRKHHCRACGLLVCYLCSGNQSLIAGAEKLGQQRICNDCCSKDAAKIAVPISPYPTLDWGRPYGDEDVKAEAATVASSDRDPETDSTVDGSVTAIGPTEIHSVDVRTISATQASHEAMKAAATPKKTPAKTSPKTPAKTPAKTPGKEQEHIPATPASTASNNTSAGSMSSFEPEPKVQLIGIDGVKLTVTYSMMVFEQDLLLARLGVRELKNHAVDHPKMLLGWQITTDVDVKPESIYIITDIRKNSSYKTEFKLVQVTSDMQVKEVWTLLKRSVTKVGIDFVPMRKVLYIGEHDLTKNIDLTMKKRRSSLRL